jgi:hypothetical protein
VLSVLELPPALSDAPVPFDAPEPVEPLAPSTAPVALEPVPLAPLPLPPAEPNPGGLSPVLELEQAASEASSGNAARRKNLAMMASLDSAE